jgi:hypothetical protein
MVAEGHRAATRSAIDTTPPTVATMKRSERSRNPKPGTILDIKSTMDYARNALVRDGHRAATCIATSPPYDEPIRTTDRNRQLVQQRQHILIVTVVLRSERRLTKATEITTDQPMARKRGPLWIPHTPIRSTGVQEQNSRAGSKMS